MSDEQLDNVIQEINTIIQHNQYQQYMEVRNDFRKCCDTVYANDYATARLLWQHVEPNIRQSFESKLKQYEEQYKEIIDEIIIEYETYYIILTINPPARVLQQLPERTNEIVMVNSGYFQFDSNKQLFIVEKWRQCCNDHEMQRKRNSNLDTIRDARFGRTNYNRLSVWEAWSLQHEKEEAADREREKLREKNQLMKRIYRKIF